MKRTQTHFRFESFLQIRWVELTCSLFTSMTESGKAQEKTLSFIPEFTRSFVKFFLTLLNTSLRSDTAWVESCWIIMFWTVGVTVILIYRMECSTSKVIFKIIVYSGVEKKSIILRNIYFQLQLLFKLTYDFSFGNNGGNVPNWTQ